MNILYVGIENHITAVAENCNCDSLVVKATNATVTGEKCLFTIIPTEVGKSIISIHTKRNNKLLKIGESEFRCLIYRPLPVLNLDNAKPKMTPTEVNSQNGVHLYQEYIDWDPETIFTIDTFSVEIIRDSVAYLTVLNTGRKFNSDVKHALSFLKPKDKLVFKDITIKTKSGYIMHLENRKIEIVE